MRDVVKTIRAVDVLIAVVGISEVIVNAEPDEIGRRAGGDGSGHGNRREQPCCVSPYCSAAHV